MRSRLGLILITIFGCLSASTDAYTPAPRSKLRQDILDVIRPYCERELHQSVIFTVFTLSVTGDNAVAILAPLQKNGRPVPPVQRYLAVLTRANQTWRIETLRPNPNDTEIANASKWLASNSHEESSEVDAPNQTDSQNQRLENLDQREAELTRRAAELDRRAAQLTQQQTHISATPAQPGAVPPSTIKTDSAEGFLNAFKNVPDAFNTDELEQNKTYRITEPHGTEYFQIAQVTNNAIVISDAIRDSSSKLIAVLVPEEAAALESFNLQTRSSANPLNRAAWGRALGRFSKFQEIELTTGEATRLPVFVISGLQLGNGKYLDMSKK